MLGSQIESCNDCHTMVVDEARYQPLLAAVYTAFSEHRPLVLSPDAVWLTIAQGVAHHMAIHAERLRSWSVSHQESSTYCSIAPAGSRNRQRTRGPRRLLPGPARSATTWGRRFIMPSPAISPPPARSSGLSAIS